MCNSNLLACCGILKLKEKMKSINRQFCWYYGSKKWNTMYMSNYFLVDHIFILFCFYVWLVHLFLHSLQSKSRRSLNQSNFVADQMLRLIVYLFLRLLTSMKGNAQYMSIHLSCRPDVDFVCLLHLFAWLFIHFIERRCTCQITFLADQMLS